MIVYGTVSIDDEYGHIMDVFGVYATEAEAEAAIPEARRRCGWAEIAVEEFVWKSEAAPGREDNVNS